MKILTRIYQEFADVKTFMQECGAMLWSKLDADVLKSGGDKFEK